MSIDKYAALVVVAALGFLGFWVYRQPEQAGPVAVEAAAMVLVAIRPKLVEKKNAE